MSVKNLCLTSYAHTLEYSHDPTIRVTLIPICHFAHPHFFQQVSLLLCQHQSVLMEGHYPNCNAPFGTVVAPTELKTDVIPVEYEASYLDASLPGDNESKVAEKIVCGWEPIDINEFVQPPSWGVKNSPNFTVLHAAELYDAEALPVWARLRFNFPLIGNLAREKHCLEMLPKLVAQGYRTFAIPWGASHMSLMDAMLRENGFREIGAVGIPVFRAVDGEVSESYVLRYQRRWNTTRSIVRYGSLVFGWCFGIFIGWNLLYEPLN